MRFSELVTDLGDGRWRCGACQWCCELGTDEPGRCLVRIGRADGIEVLHDGLISAAQVGPIEELRLWHFFPGTRMLSLGSFGYAFPVDQQRGPNTTIPEDESKRRQLEPERAATFALDKLCRGVVWSYSDPAVSHEYVLDLLRTCRASSRYTALVTNGYMSLESLDAIGHYLDGMCIELRAFDDAAYRRLAGIEQWRGILDVATRARQHWRCFIEIVTRIHPGVNDQPEILHAQAEWIRDQLGPHTPWHILPGDAGSGAASVTARARRIAHEAGLHFVYGAEPNQSTVCPYCSTTLIERNGATVKLVRLEESLCGNCGRDVQIRTSLFKRV